MSRRCHNGTLKNEQVQKLLKPKSYSVLRPVELCPDTSDHEDIIQTWTTLIKNFKQSNVGLISEQCKNEQKQTEMRWIE